MLTGGDDKKVILWDLKTLKQIIVLEDSKKSKNFIEHKSAIVSVSINQDLKWCLTADVDSKVILWNLDSGIPEVLCSIEGKIKEIIYLSDETGFLLCTNKGVEKWMFDWVLTVDGKDYPPPVWTLLSRI